MEKDKKQSRTGLWGLFIKFAGKFGVKFFGLLGKVFKLGKFSLAAITFSTYALMFTWKFALLIMIALGVHETGHVHAMRTVGVKTKGFYYIPFLGGAAIMEENCKSYRDFLYVAIMGPVYGFGLSLASLIAYWFTGYPLFAAAAGWMALLNIFNLLPINPLDGGKIFRSICFSVHSKVGLASLVASFALCMYIAIAYHISLLWFLMIFGAIETFGEWLNYKNRKQDAELFALMNEVYVAMNRLESLRDWRKTLNIPNLMTPKQTIISTIGYIILTTALIAIMYLTKHIAEADVAMKILVG